MRYTTLSIYIDLSQPIENSMTYFPGDPEPRIIPADSTPPWHVTELHIGTHVGTHIDAAFHFFPHGETITGYPVDRFILPGIVVHAVGRDDDEPINVDALRDSLLSLPKGGALLLHTGWDRFWKTERYFRHPYLTREAAQFIVVAGVRIVGVDALNPDSTVQETSHAHEMLLGNDVLIVENLTRLHLLTHGVVYQCSFLPLAIVGVDGSPVRAVAWQG